MPTTDDTDPIPQPDAPNMRTFAMNSKEFYEAVTRPPEPHMWGPGLPSEPRVWDLPVIVEHSQSAKKSHR